MRYLTNFELKQIIGGASDELGGADFIVWTGEYDALNQKIFVSDASGQIIHYNDARMAMEVAILYDANGGGFQSSHRRERYTDRR